MNDGAEFRSDVARSDKPRPARATKPVAAPAERTIVPFRPAAAGSRRSVAQGEPRGEILLFTGVRYERRETPVVRARPQRRTAEGLRQPQS